MRTSIGTRFGAILAAATAATVVAAPRGVADPVSDPEDQAERESDENELAAQEHRDGVAGWTATEPSPPVAPPPPVTDLGEYVESMLRPADEPSLEETMAAAIAYARLEPEAEKDLASGAAWAALLPRVRVTFRRDWEHDRSLDLDHLGRGDFGIDTDNDLEFGITAQWQLSDLVAPPAEISARRLAIQAEAARRNLRLAVAQAYLERRRLRLQWDAVAPEEVAARSAIAAAIAERTAQLDALTGGRFGRAVDRIGETMERGDEWNSDEIDDTR